MKALQLARIEAMNAELIKEQSAQSQITPGLTLLATAYEHDGLLLDLYGTSRKDGIEVEDIALTGDKRSLAPLFSANQFEDMGYWCERQSTREYQAGALDRALDKADDRFNHWY